MHSTRRHDSRRPINHLLIAPGPLVGTIEDFVIEDLSTGGISLLRAAPTTNVVDKKALDLRFAWLTVPLPGSNADVTALIEVVHRERQGSTELVRARFEEMSFDDRVRLCDYLAQRDRQAPQATDRPTVV